MSGGKGNSRANTSSASTTTVNETTTTSIDNRVFALDPGAIEAGRALGGQALDVGLDALRIGSDAVMEAANLTGRGLDNTQAAYEGALSFGETAIGANERASRDALDFGTTALDAHTEVTREALNFGRGAIDANTGLARDAMREIADFGGVAIGEVRSIGRDAIDAVGAAQQGVLDFALDVFGGAIGAQKDLTAAHLAGNTALARETSQSSDDRVTKVALYAFAALAIIFVLGKLR